LAQLQVILKQQMAAVIVAHGGTHSLGSKYIKFTYGYPVFLLNWIAILS
jgi:hypothetical protein